MECLTSHLNIVVPHSCGLAGNLTQGGILSSYFLDPYKSPYRITLQVPWSIFGGPLLITHPTQFNQGFPVLRPLVHSPVVNVWK